MDIRNRITLNVEFIDNKKKVTLSIGGRNCGQLEMTPREFFILHGVIAQGSINMYDEFFDELDQIKE